MRLTIFANVAALGFKKEKELMRVLINDFPKLVAKKFSISKQEIDVGISRLISGPSKKLVRIVIFADDNPVNRELMSSGDLRAREFAKDFHECFAGGWIDQSVEVHLVSKSDSFSPTVGP